MVHMVFISPFIYFPADTGVIKSYSAARKHNIANRTAGQDCRYMVIMSAGAGVCRMGYVRQKAGGAWGRCCFYWRVAKI